ncbi:MAG: hypothetical protein EZS28_015556, partial [Streblomastix strix]
IGSKFENIWKTGGGNGSVIEGYLNNNNGKMSLKMIDEISNIFINCKVDIENGIGGAIYLKISNGGESKYDLSGGSYSQCNGLYGKSLFIDAYDLKLSLQGSIDGILDSVYHVSNNDSNPKGIDNIGCGDLKFPCLTIDYAILQRNGDKKFSVRSGTLTLQKITFCINNSADSGYVIEGISSSNGITMNNCKMIMSSDSTRIYKGLIDLSKGSLILINLEIQDIIVSGYSMIRVNSGAGIVSIRQSNFENIQRIESDGKGGIIEGNISINNGKISVSNSRFSNCSVDINTGIGGCIYLDIGIGAESKFDLSGTSYSNNNEALYGKSLFIHCRDSLRSVIGIGSESRIKIGGKETENDFKNLMGYDGSDSNLAIPLYFVYTEIDSSIYHVNNGKLEIVSCSFGAEDESSQLGAPAIKIEDGCTQLIISNTKFTKLLSGGIQLESGQSSFASIEDCYFTNCGDGSQISGAVYVVGVIGNNLGSVSITDSQFISCKGSQSGGIVFGDNVILSNVKDNFFYKNIISDDSGAKDVYFLSNEMVDQAGGIEFILQGYRYDKTDGYIGDVKISKYQTNFAQYLDCKTEGQTYCGILTCEEIVYCNKLNSEQLSQIDISTCSCYEFGDPRSQCSSQTQECNLATQSDLMNVSIGACSCYSVGDPRIECSDSTIDCNNPSADLSNIPISLCPCNDDNDPRRGITCAVSRMCLQNDLVSTPCLCSSQYNSGNCTCSQEYHDDQQCICDQSQESGVYDLTSCRSTKICIGDDITQDPDPINPGGNNLPFWLILVIIILACLVTLIFIFCCVAFICQHKTKQKHKKKKIRRITHQTIEFQRLKFQKQLQEQELKERYRQELQRAFQQQRQQRQLIQTISPRKKLTRRQQRQIEKKAGLTILRALLWNRDYHASRPAFELMRQQRNVVQELIDSEKNYVSKLEDCIKYYLQPLQKLSKDKKIKVSQNQLKDIFINMEQILKFHKLFSHDLQTVAKKWTVHSRVGQMFCKQAPFMKVSVEYFQKKEKSSKLLRELLKSDPKFNQIVDDISQQDEVNHEPLEQFLNRPVKRISEYNLLLQKMNESMFDWQHDSKHVHHASKMMEEFASFFNFCIHRKANMEKVLDIEQQIISYNPISIMLKLAEEATQIELAKKQGLKLDEFEIMKIRLQQQKYFHEIKLVRPSRCFVGDIEVFQVDANNYQRRYLILLSDVLLICKKKRFQQKYELMNVLNVETLEFRMAGKMQDMEQLSKLKQEINQQIKNQKELERKQLKEYEEQIKNINDTKLIMKIDINKRKKRMKQNQSIWQMIKEKQKQLYLMNAIEGRFLFFLFTPTNTYLFDAMNSEARRRFITKLEGYVKKQDENIQKKAEEDDQYEEIEYEEEQEVEQEIEQEELVPITETSPIQEQNEKQIDKDKDKDDDNLDDLEIPPRNCVSPSLVNSFLPPIKPVLWARLLNDWQVDWKIQIEQDQPRPEEYIPLLKQDSGSKYYNIVLESDKIQEKIDELKKKPTSSKKEKNEKSSSNKDQYQDHIFSPQITKRTQTNAAADENEQPKKDKDKEKQNEKQIQDEEDNELLDPELFKMRILRAIIPSFQQFEEMRRKLAKQSSYLKGYSDKGRQQRMKSGYKVLGLAVDDAEKNSVPVAPQMLPPNHPFVLHSSPRKQYQKQINKMIYTKSQIAEILATKELKSIFDTPWFQEYTEEFKNKNYKNIAMLTQHQIYEAQIPDHIIELPELTKQEKKSTLRFGYVDSDSDYVINSDDEEEEEQEQESQEKEKENDSKYQVKKSSKSTTQNSEIKKTKDSQSASPQSTQPVQVAAKPHQFDQHPNYIPVS